MSDYDAAQDEITRLRAENKSMDKIIMSLIDRLGAITSARILQGKDIAELSAKNERLREALVLCRTELRTAAGYRGYEGGPLDHPSVGLALREADAALNGEIE